MRWGELRVRLDVSYNNPLHKQLVHFRYAEQPLKKLLVYSFGGGTPSKSVDDYWEGDISWASPKDFSDATQIALTQDRITEEGREAARLNIAASGTVLLVVRSGILQHTLPIAVCTQPMTINQDIKALVVREDINPQFLAEYLHVRQNALLPLITKHSTTVQSVNTAELEKLPIPIPPLNIQSTLVREIETARASRNQKLAQADELLNSLG